MNSQPELTLQDWLAQHGGDAARLLAALVAHVQQDGKLPPRSEWIWQQAVAASSSGEPSYLVALLTELPPQTVTRLLGNVLRSMPTPDILKTMCEALLAVGESDSRKRLALAAVIDNHHFPRPLILDLLRSSKSLRLRLFQQYPEQQTVLPTLLRSVIDDLPEDPEFERSLDVLLDAKPLLPNDQKRIAGWRNLRKHVLQLNADRQQTPGFLARLKGAAARQQEQRDRLGREFAEAASWALPNELFPSDPEGTVRTHRVSELASRLLTAGALPANWQQGLANTFAGRDWSAAVPVARATTPATPAKPSVAARPKPAKPAPLPSAPVPSQPVAPVPTTAVAPAVDVSVDHVAQYFQLHGTLPPEVMAAWPHWEWIGAPHLLAGLFEALPARQGYLLLNLLRQMPTELDAALAICNGLTTNTAANSTRAEWLVDFLDHPQISDEVLLGVLRSDCRAAVWNLYRRQVTAQSNILFRVPVVLDELLESLPDDRNIRPTLQLLCEGEALLSLTSRQQLLGWRVLCEQLAALPKPTWFNAAPAPSTNALTELSKAARQALPNSLYSEDNDGQCRAQIIESVAARLNPPVRLAAQTRVALAAHIAGKPLPTTAVVPNSTDWVALARIWFAQHAKQTTIVASVLLVLLILFLKLLLPSGTSSKIDPPTDSVAQRSSTAPQPADESLESPTSDPDPKPQPPEPRPANTPDPSVKPQTPDKPRNETPQPKPNPPKQPEPTVVGSVPPKSPTEPPKPIPPKAEPPSSSTMTFNKGPEQKLIAYAELPEYSAADKSKPELRIELPEGNPVTAIQLLGFKEHKERLADSDFNVLKGSDDDAARLLDVMHACLSDAGGTTLPLCTFEISENKLLRARWQHHKTIGDVKPLVDAVRCCVLEIQRGENRDEWLYVCFLKPVTMAQALEFVDGKYQLLSDQLPLVLLSNPLSFGDTQLRVYAPKPIDQTFDFISPGRPRFPAASMDQMKAKFGFATATLTADKEKGQATHSLEMKVQKRSLSPQELEEIARITARTKELRGLRSAALKGTAAHGVLASELKVSKGEKEDDRAFNNRVYKEFENQIAKLDERKRELQDQPEVERRLFLGGKPLLSGTLYRVVGGRKDGIDLGGGVVVEAIHIPEPKEKGKPKEAAGSPTGI